MNYKELLFNKDKALTFYPELAVILNEYDKYLVKIGYEINGKKWKSKQCGLNAAIVVNQINYWNELNEKLKSKKHFKDGYYWTYHAYDKWAKEDFPFWSGDTVRRAVKFLEDIGLVISTSEYNSWAADNTKWYRIDFEKLQEIINIVEELRKERQKDEIEKQVADTVNADCGCVLASCIDGLGSVPKAIPEINTENTNRDYNTENTGKYALEDVKRPSSKGNMYASVPEEQEAAVPKKQSRYIPKDYTEEQLIKHIRPTIEDNLKTVQEDSGLEYNPKQADDVVEVVTDFFEQYRKKTGHRHKILPDATLINIMYRYFNPPECLWNSNEPSTYSAMAEEYLDTNFNTRGGYDGQITLSISHFMSDAIRETCYHRTK